MKKINKILLGVALSVMLLAPLLILAAPYDWRVIYRNSDDTADTDTQVPSFVNNHYAVLGQRYGGDGGTSWYYFDPTNFAVSNGGGTLGTNNYILSVANIEAHQVSDLADYLESSVLSQVAFSGSFNDITGFPTSVSYFDNDSNYMVADGTGLDNIFSSNGLLKRTGSGTYNVDTTSYFATPSGTTAQYVRGNGTLSTFPTLFSGAYSDLTGKPSLFSGSYTDLTSKPTLGVAYEGTTQRTGSFPIFKTATISSGIATVHLTADGTSGGSALCTNGVIQDSVSIIFNDSNASFQQSWAFSNSNKTVTVTANKFTTANILSGILGQAAANGSVVKITVWCY